MTSCAEILDLLPWYVTGTLDSTSAAAVAAHIQTCEACRGELAEVTWVRHAVGRKVSGMPAMRQRVWRRVLAATGLRDLANIDIGSFLVGFRVGVNARRRGSPVRASLQVMGRHVRVVGSKPKAPPTSRDVE